MERGRDKNPKALHEQMKDEMEIKRPRKVLHKGDEGRNKEKKIKKSPSWPS